MALPTGNYRFVPLAPGSSAPPELVAEWPYAEAYLRSAAALSQFDPARCIRRYVLDILQNGGFDMVSPRTGAVIRSGSSLVLNDKSVFFSFPAEPELFAGVDNLSTGFPISAMLDTSRGLLVSTGNPVWGINAKSLDALQAAMLGCQWAPMPVEGPPCLVTGDDNFAHHAWNQMPSLLAAMGTGAAFELVSTFEPLGKLDDLLPELRTKKIHRVPGTWLHRANRPGRVFLPLGSMLLTHDVRACVLDFAAWHLSPRGSAIAVRLAGPERKIWLSLRTRNRTMSNQIEVLTALARAIFAHYPGAMIVLDGHSLPADLESNPGSYAIEQLRAVVAADEAAAGAIIEALAGVGEVVTAIGLPITDSIHLAGFADFYVCHHGTVQHKIGWFHSTPGIVHSNEAVLRQNPAFWVAAQSEIAVVPAYLPVDFVRNEEADAGADDQQQRELRLDNYTILDVDKFAAYVMARLTAVLTPAAVPSRPAHEAAGGSRIRVFLCGHELPARGLQTSLFQSLISGKPGSADCLSDLDGENIADANEYSELRHQYHVWKTYAPHLDYVGFEHYRRVLFIDPLAPAAFGADPAGLLQVRQILSANHQDIFPLSNVQFEAYLEMRRRLDEGQNAALASWIAGTDVITVRPDRVSVEETWKKHHDAEHWPMIVEAVRAASYFASRPCHIDFATSRAYYKNAYIMRADLFDEYMGFVFEICAALKRRLPRQQPRMLGYVAERLFSLWMHQKRVESPLLRVVEVPLLFRQDG